MPSCMHVLSDIQRKLKLVLGGINCQGNPNISLGYGMDKKYQPYAQV